MKFVKHMPKTDSELSAKLKTDGWEKIKEPKNISLATLLSLPFAILLSAITVWLTYYLNPSIYSFISSNGFNITINILYILLFILIVFAFMLVHEFIHAFFIPDFRKSNKTFWGINGLFGFVFTTEKLKKSRFIIISIMPYLLLSVLLPFILNFFGLLNTFTMMLCLVNAMGSCVDLLNICLIVFQVPNSSLIINNGFETFYKLAE